MDINNILLDLEIIKQINENDKLAVSHEKGITKLYVHRYSYILSLKRWYYGYSRDDTLNYLEKLIDNIEKSSNMIINGNHIDHANLLKNSISNSLIGFKNLKNTYQNDSLIYSKIILIENKLVSVKEILEKFTTITIEEMEDIEKNNN